VRANVQAGSNLDALKAYATRALRRAGLIGVETKRGPAWQYHLSMDREGRGEGDRVRNGRAG